MPDRDRVIYSIERCICYVPDSCRDCAYDKYEYPDCVNKMCKDALELLKAQEPVKPYVSGNGKGFENASTWWYACGACNEQIDMHDKFCRHCGKAVKWDE